MKKVMLLAIIVIYSIGSLFSQTTISGIGKLKLYSPISIINDLGYNSKTKKLSTQGDYYRYIYEKSTGSNIYEIIADSITGTNGCFGYFNPKIRLFYLPNYEITSTLKITQVKLLFYNDILISIECYGGSELVGALDLKYGKSETKYEKEDHTFTYTYTGAKIVKTDETFISTWNTNLKNVSCVRTLMSFFNDKGEELFSSILKLCDKTYDSEIFEIEQSIKNRKEYKDLEIKKKSLEGI